MQEPSYKVELLTQTGSAQTTIFRLIETKSGISINKNLHQIYDERYIEKFNKKTRHYIAYVMSLTDTDSINDKRKEISYSHYFNMIGIFFTTFLILSNLAGMKVSSFFGLTVASGIVFFPLTYIFDDIITEVYGYNKSRKIIWAAFLANLIFILGLYLVIYLPYNKQIWNLQAEIEAVFLISPRILFASCIAFLTGEFINSYILAVLKIAYNGQYFALRAITSTIFGVLIENIIFCSIAFYGVLQINIIIKMILSQFLIKISYEVLMLPITKRIVFFLKNREEIDYYDYHTNFNPFSLK